MPEPPTSIPVGINISSIGVTAGWWLETARQAESVGFSAVWCSDHFLSRGRKTDGVLECWTMLAAAGAVTTRVRVGSFVTNVMNRHPSLLARMAATVQDQTGGRLEVGIGVGGHPTEHGQLGIYFPDVSERVERLEEAVQVLRLLWTGGPVSYEGRYYQLRDAYAHPVPQPPPRIVVGGETPGGARLAARVGDAWTTPAAAYERLRPIYEEALAAAGRRRDEVSVVVALDLEKGVPPESQPVFAELGSQVEQWRQRGADELILSWVRQPDVPAALAAAERARLAA